MRGAFFFHQLLLLGQSYFELKTLSPSEQDVRVERVFVPMDTINNSSSCLIPVSTPRKLEVLSAIISKEDYERIVAISPTWRISSSGYVVIGKRINGKNTLRYLHKEIFGGTCTHINGDKLDNRRCNLVGSKKRRRPADLNLESIMQFIDDPVIYPDGKQYYGEQKDSVPQGFGLLVESKKRSMGWWDMGVFTNGLVMDLVPVPDRMKELVTLFHPVSRVIMVHNKKLIKCYEC